MRAIASVPIAARRRNLVQGGWRRDCPACKAEHFPRTDPVVIMLPIAGERCVLMARWSVMTQVKFRGGIPAAHFPFMLQDHTTGPPAP